MFFLIECLILEDVIEFFKKDIIVGLVVIMFYKNLVMLYLDELDELVMGIGVCNNVYYKLGELCICVGINIDW